MASLGTQFVTTAGTTVAMGPAAAGGDTFFPNSTTFLQLTNGGGSSVTVTVASTVPCNQGVKHPVSVTVTAGATEVIGPLPAGRFADANGQGSITYSAVTSVTVAAVQISNAQLVAILVGGTGTEVVTQSGLVVVTQSGNALVLAAA